MLHCIISLLVLVVFQEITTETITRYDQVDQDNITALGEYIEDTVMYLYKQKGANHFKINDKWDEAKYIISNTSQTNIAEIGQTYASFQSKITLLRDAMNGSNPNVADCWKFGMDYMQTMGKDEISNYHGSYIKYFDLIQNVSVNSHNRLEDYRVGFSTVYDSYSNCCPDCLSCVQDAAKSISLFERDERNSVMEIYHTFILDLVKLEYIMNELLIHNEQFSFYDDCDNVYKSYIETCFLDTLSKNYKLVPSFDKLDDITNYKNDIQDNEAQSRKLQYYEVDQNDVTSLRKYIENVYINLNTDCSAALDFINGNLDKGVDMTYDYQNISTKNTGQIVTRFLGKLTELEASIDLTDIDAIACLISGRNSLLHIVSLQGKYMQDHWYILRSFLESLREMHYVLDDYRLEMYNIYMESLDCCSTCLDCLRNLASRTKLYERAGNNKIMDGMQGLFLDSSNLKRSLNKMVLGEKINVFLDCTSIYTSIQECLANIY